MHLLNRVESASALVVGNLHQPRLGPAAQELLSENLARGLYFWRVLASIPCDPFVLAGDNPVAALNVALRNLATAGYQDGRWHAWPCAPRLFLTQASRTLAVRLVTVQDVPDEQLGDWLRDLTRWGAPTGRELVVIDGVLDLAAPCPMAMELTGDLAHG